MTENKRFKRLTHFEIDDTSNNYRPMECASSLDADVICDLLNTLHEENQSYKQKVHETLQKYIDEYMDKEHTDLDPMVYASEVIDEIAEELGVELE